MRPIPYICFLGNAKISRGARTQSPTLRTTTVIRGHVLPDYIIWHRPLVFVVTVKDVFCFVCFMLGHFFGDKRSQLFAISGCSARGQFGPLSGDVQPPAVLAFEGARIGQSGVPFSVTWGTNAVKRGGIGYNLVDFVGYTLPPTFYSEGGPGCPSFAATPFLPQHRARKKKEVCVLGMGCGCHVLRN